jgi:NitT/TauT family transport system substrate-binding protein
MSMSALFRAAGLFLLSMALASCSAPEPEGEPAIRINTAGLIGEAGIFLALDNGYFAEEGVRVELIPAIANASTDNLAQLATGDLDVAVFGPTAAMFNAIERGFDVIGIMPLNTLTPGDNSRGIVVRKDLIDSGRFKTPADFRGLRIGTLTTGGVGHFFVAEALAKGRLTQADIDLSTLPMPDSVIALSTGSIDAAFLVEPFVSAARERGVGVLALSSAETSPGVPTAMMFASTTFARKHPGLLERFTTAVLRGQRDYAEAVATGRGRDRLLRSLQKHTATKDIEKLKALSLPHVDPDGGFDTAGLLRLRDFFIRNGALKHRIAADRVFDRRYVAYARARLRARDAADKTP